MSQIPKHIGYIVDGNRRWAKQHGKPSYEGHLAGYDALRKVIDATIEAGVPYVSIYAFSTENWKRGKGEVSKLMQLAHLVAKRDVKEYVEKGVRIKFLGCHDGLSKLIIKDMAKTEEKTKLGGRGTIAICFNYGGQREIADAAKKCVEDGLPPDEITEEAIEQRLYQPDIPPVDVVVRTSGEHRLSNFMLWRTAYSEFIFLDKFFPEMTEDDVAAIIDEYSQRTRRFGS
jgi:undecaprenyl diphosphate synthase